MKSYDPSAIEPKWQHNWETEELYKNNPASQAQKYYCLDMFPYPSGIGLHLGHWRGYSFSDAIGRYHRLHGKNVLHPMGFDAFGLPAENAAIKNHEHPQKFTDEAVKKFTGQLKQIGAMYDWDRLINSSLPEYYKWTQWIFLQLYHRGLAYKKKAPVNWCPSCQTVLANEQVINGECERCGTSVVQKKLDQWFFKITDYADRLLRDLDNLKWPERVKILQRNWVGKSEGSTVKFAIIDSESEALDEIEVFTTRIDTLFGCTYLVLSPEHEAIEKLQSNITNWQEIADYRQKANQKTELERAELQKEKTGIKLDNITAINPANNQQIPVFVADYVIASYGTGAVMAVPAHDERDFAFAMKYHLPIIQVITSEKAEQNKDILNQAFIDYGKLINSEEFNGLTSPEAMKQITDKLKIKKQANFKVHYRLRDWLISRQRYWGAPIPMIFCQKCGLMPEAEENLPVILPQDVDFQPTGESPLAKNKQFLQTTCPKCHSQAQREVDTMDTFVDSSWYYLRYLDPKNETKIFDKDKSDYWMPVDFYVGGIEHAILHLLYARFIYKVLADLKLVGTNEPFNELFSIGMIYLHGTKMSKSKGNVISPDDLVKKYGSDSLRGYELFIGPADQDAEWNPQGISGIYRFLTKAWQLGQRDNWLDEETKETQVNLHKTIESVTNDFEHYKLNTVISSLMILINKFSQTQAISKNSFKTFLILLSPIAPHLTEELWHQFDEKESIFNSQWPKAIVQYLADEKLTIIIQINGKFRGKIEVAQNTNDEEVKQLSQSLPEVAKWLKDKKIVNIIYKAGKLLNFVVS